MDPDPLGKSTTNAPRKVRFAPKAPPKKEQKPVLLPKVEKTENDIDGAQAEQLLRKLNESSVRGKPKAERKIAPNQVAFGNAGSSASLRSYGRQTIHLNQGSSSNGGGEPRVEKEYKEPWDYYTYYPVTLPIRRPYSGNPELLDKEEFDDDPERSAYDEYATAPAAELGLMEDNLEGKMMFLQLPANLPTLEQSTNAEVHGTDDKSNVPKGASQKPCKLESLPAGLMGKMLVYKSGAVKMKLGDTLYDVSAGLSALFSQDVLAVNIEDGHCCNMGELNNRAVLMPDVDSILDSMADL